MKLFSCGDVVPGCPARFEAADTPALVTAVREHAARDHGLADPPPDLLRAVLQAVRDG